MTSGTQTRVPVSKSKQVDAKPPVTGDAAPAESCTSAMPPSQINKNDLIWLVPAFAAFLAFSIVILMSLVKLLGLWDEARFILQHALVRLLKVTWTVAMTGLGLTLVEMTLVCVAVVTYGIFWPFRKTVAYQSLIDFLKAVVGQHAHAAAYPLHQGHY